MAANQELAGIFSTLANLMDLRGENSFKVLAFRRVGRILNDLLEDIGQVVEEGRLDEVEGIGEHSRRIIEEYLATGRSSDLEQLAATVPPGLLPLLGVEGLGPKTIALLWRERNITSADELAAAIQSGALAGLKGIGEKKIEAIRRGLEAKARHAGRVGIALAFPPAEELAHRLRQLPQVQAVEIAGSLRRRRETVGDVDLIGVIKPGADGEEVTAAFAKFPEVAHVHGQGVTKASIVTRSGLQVDLRIIPGEHFGAALLYFTGSKEHNVKIRGLAQKHDMTLSEWGLYSLKDQKKIEKETGKPPAVRPIASKTEEDIYRKLGMDYIPPEIREDRGEIEAALEHRLPKLIDARDIHGDLHCHTVASDGAASIEQMAEAAAKLGYEYLAITDHSKSSVIANGLTAQRLLKHLAEIRKVGQRLKGITLLAGCEVDILPDGRMDYEEAVLAELDFVIGSPHASLKQDQAKATDRIRRAIETRYVNVIGHPTGRMIGAREGLPLDFPAIIKAAAQTGTALEINSGYPRLDLDDQHSRSAINAGVKLAINTDAHHPADFAWLVFGLGVARRAWATAADVINAWPLAKLRDFIGRKR